MQKTYDCGSNWPSLRYRQVSISEVVPTALTIDDHSPMHALRISEFEFFGLLLQDGGSAGSSAVRLVFLNRR